MLMAGIRIETADNVLVRIESADGFVGWGEATVAPTMTGDLAEGLVAAVQYLTRLLLGQDARQHAALALRCLNAMHGNGGAKSAIDMALLDLVGRRMGIPIVEFLGGPLREAPIPMWLLGNSSASEDAAEAKAKCAEGFKFLKLKIGIKPIVEEIAAAVELRNELGPDIVLCADANMGLEPSRALEFVRRAADIDLHYLEQPVRAENLNAMQALTALGLIPICADEGIAGAAEVLAHDQARAMRGINLKLMKAGGPRAAMRVAALCEALGLSITVAGKIAESSISASATLAVACAAPNVDWGLNLTHIYLAEDLVRNPISLEKGVFVRPRGPGNGLEVDENVVARCRV
jgi:muconate cycloisomerase